MPTSPTGKANRRRSAGFTLIELLVVIAIVSILSLGVTLRVGGVLGGPSRLVPEQAAALASAVRRARDLAVLGRVTVGLYPRRDGWIMARRDAAGDWVALAPLRAGATLDWTVAGRAIAPGLADPAPGDRPAIRFRPDGGGTAFSLVIAGQGEHLRCRSGEWEAVQCG